MPVVVRDELPIMRRRAFGHKQSNKMYCLALAARRKSREEGENCLLFTSCSFYCLCCCWFLVFQSNATLQQVFFLFFLNLCAVYLAASASFISFCLSAHNLLQHSPPPASLQPAEEAADHVWCLFFSLPVRVRVRMRAHTFRSSL